MTRQEAIRHIVDLAKHLDKIDEELEAEKLLAALGRLISEPEPDPDTGLVPCGCGGKAVIHDHQNYGETGMNYWVGCDNQECDCTVGMYLDETGRFEKKEDAIKAWNKAHGYKDGAE